MAEDKALAESTDKNTDKKVAQQPYQAANPSVSAWVSANAGSGKTYVLVTRLVTLLLEGTPPERLLCLTYTRMAAAEMQERLFQLLGAWAVLPDDELKQAMTERIGKVPTKAQIKNVRPLFAKALETPGGLKIQTIHAFCESLLHRFPLEAGVSPRFELLDERQADELVSQLRRDILTDSQTEDLSAALNLLLRHFLDPQFTELAKHIIKHRHLFASLSPADRKKTLLEKLGFTANVPDLAEIIHSVIAKINPDHIKEAIAQLANSSQRDEQQAKRLKHLLASMRAEPRDIDEIWANLHALFFTRTSGPRKQVVTKKFADRNPAIAKRIEEWGALYLAKREIYYKAQCAHMTLALYQFADILLAMFAERKRQLGQLDYDDLIEKTSALLKTNEATAWVLYKLDGGLDHILVDEAQDTNMQQWGLIKALAEEFFAGDTRQERDTRQEIVRTIFAVGDEKQSIFRFQGADPTAFDNMRTHFKTQAENAAQNFHDIALNLSRRSTPEILSIVDWICDLPFMQNSLTQQKQKITHEVFRQKKKGLVELWEVEESQRAETDNLWVLPETINAPTPAYVRLAERIAEQINDWLADPHSNITASDILILVQHRLPFVPAMLRALKRFNIPVTGADRMKLTEQIAIMDLIAAGHVALLPKDDFNLACFLRSPLGGIDEEALYELCYGRETDLMSRLRQAAAKKAAPQSIKSALARIDDMLSVADYLPPFEFYMRLLEQQKGRKDLIARLGMEINDPLNEFLNLALDYERQFPPSLQGFLHWIVQGEVEVKRDMEQTSGAVRIMTIHGAKGLEAPIIFMPDTCRPAHKSSSHHEPLAIIDDDLPIWKAKKAEQNLLSQSADEAEKKLQAEEHKRLFYVAMTRARDRLYIGGWIGANRKSPPEDSWYALAHKIMTKHGKCINTDYGKIWRKGKAGFADAKIEPTIKPAQFAPPAWLNQTAPVEAAVLDIENPSHFLPAPMAENVGALAGARALLRGTLIHQLIEGLAKIAPDNRLARAQAFLAPYESEFDDTECKGFIQEALAVIDEPTLAPLFGPHSRAEVPIAGELVLPSGAKRKFSGRIDRYVEMADEILLVDYKTNRTPPQDSHAIPQAYIAQMALYRALVSAAQPNKPVRCQLVWTSTAKWHVLESAAMDDALNRLDKGGS